MTAPDTTTAEGRAALRLAAEIQAVGGGATTVSAYYDVCDANEAIDDAMTREGLGPAADDHAVANRVCDAADALLAAPIDPNDRPIAREAECGLCGETFNPATDLDLVHLQRSDETECGGIGVMVGAWYAPGRRP